MRVHWQSAITKCVVIEPECNVSCPCYLVCCTMSLYSNVIYLLWGMEGWVDLGYPAMHRPGDHKSVTPYHYTCTMSLYSNVRQLTKIAVFDVVMLTVCYWRHQMVAGKCGLVLERVNKCNYVFTLEHLVAIRRRRFSQPQYHSLEPGFQVFERRAFAWNILLQQRSGPLTSFPDLILILTFFVFKFLTLQIFTTEGVKQVFFKLKRIKNKTIIMTVIFTVWSTGSEYCESSPGSHILNYELVAGNFSTKPIEAEACLWAASKLHSPLPFIINQPETGLGFCRQKPVSATHEV